MDMYALGLQYAIGFLTLPPNSDVEPGYESLWAFDRAEEKEAFKAFMVRVMDRWQHDPTMHIYHYAPYEPTAIKRLAGRHGTCVDEVDELLRAGIFVDLFRVVRQGLRASVESYSIKKLERGTDHAGSVGNSAQGAGGVDVGVGAEDVPKATAIPNSTVPLGRRSPLRSEKGNPKFNGKSNTQTSGTSSPKPDRGTSRLPEPPRQDSDTTPKVPPAAPYSDDDVEMLVNCFFELGGKILSGDDDPPSACKTLFDWSSRRPHPSAARLALVMWWGFGSSDHWSLKKTWCGGLGLTMDDFLNAQSTIEEQMGRYIKEKRLAALEKKFPTAASMYYHLVPSAAPNPMRGATGPSAATSGTDVLPEYREQFLNKLGTMFVHAEEPHAHLTQDELRSWWSEFTYNMTEAEAIAYLEWAIEMNANGQLKKAFPKASRDKATVSIGILKNDDCMDALRRRYYENVDV